VGLLAARLQQEHRVERGHFERANMRHAEHLADIADRSLGQPAVMLLLRAPQ
jgi:hypothetical protein